ncbi:MarR family transcriptional regulator [Pusillimonas sp. T2]|uniref:MarR family winged helix-turn-helix transcriptional regulator n=1 Tax=Pusillimonas sp. T2 TaxID=1548123 RepID=UPI000B9D0325|nr:MarR family transcriptional regulator [Pusillimonas sp. T2]OXR49566.1 MarR family transcriptional regulator [Pusillimonas sp. T2]
MSTNKLGAAERPTGIAYLIGRLDRMLSRKIRERLADHGITAAQYTALSVFRTHGHLSNAQLAERSLVSPQSANEMVNVMVNKGWIARQAEAVQGRVIPIGLTDAGLALMRQCDHDVARIEAEMLDGFSDEEVEHLQTQLKGLVRVLKTTSSG